MAKRYTDSLKWDDPFFADLPNDYKLLWIFILDKCNHAGIYKLNPRMAEFCLGTKYDWNKVLGVFKGRIQSLNEEKWFIPKFIEYQYGVLTDTNRVHNSIIQILNKEGLRTVLGSKDKDKDQDKVKDKDKDIIKEIIDDLNNTLNTSYKTTSSKTQQLIKARLSEGYTLENFKTVHRTKHKEWKDDPKMNKFRRPETLYSNKFESYLNQKGTPEVRRNAKGEILMGDTNIPLRHFDKK